MKRFALVAAVAAICFSFFGCHGDDTTWHTAIIKDIDSVEVDANDCSVTVCGTVRLGVREGAFVGTTAQIFMGSDGMSMDDLLSDLDPFLVKEVFLDPADADADGNVDVCVTVDLPAGVLPMALRATTGSLLSIVVPVGLVSGPPADPVEGLFCRVVGLDAELSWTLGSILPLEGITVLMDGGVVATLPGDATGTTISGIPVGATLTVRAANKYGSNDASCVVARPGTPHLLCSLVGDLIVLTWDSEANSVTISENGEVLETNLPASGSLELSDRNPGDYTYTAIGIGLGEEQPEAQSDTAECSLHRKARLVLADRCDERDVARVLLANEGSDVPVLLNAKVLTLSLGEVTGSPELTFDNERSKGSCLSVDSFFDIAYDVVIRDESFQGNFETIEATLDGEPIEVDVDGEDGTAEVEIETCAPGTYELVINMSQEFEFEVEIDTNEGEPNGDTTIIETEIVALSLTASIPVLQDEHPLFGDGERVSRKLRIPSSCYADAFIDDQSNTGNRVVLVDKIAYGQGFGIGKAFGDIDLNVTGSAWYDDYLRTYGFGISHFFDNNFPTIFGHEFGNEDYVFVPVVTHGYTEGDVEFELEASGYVELQVGVGVWVRVPITAHKDLDEYFVTHLAGRNAIGKPDCKAFGVGREAGHLTLAFIDNVIVDGPGFDVRIYERSTPDATESFFLHTYLNRFFNVSDQSWTGRAPSFDGPENFYLPVDQNVPTVSLGFGYRVIEREDCDGYLVELDLASLGIPYLNLSTIVSGGEGNTIEGDFRDLFAGADIDAICGLNNRFGLRVLPQGCTEETEEGETTTTFRDLVIEGLFFDEDDEEEQEQCERNKLWRYKLCADVFCDGFENDPLATNEVLVETKLKPYFVRSHLKQNAVCGLAKVADQLDEDFGLDE